VAGGQSLAARGKLHALPGQSRQLPGELGIGFHEHGEARPAHHDFDVYLIAAEAGEQALGVHDGLRPSVVKNRADIENHAMFGGLGERGEGEGEKHHERGEEARSHGVPFCKRLGSGVRYTVPMPELPEVETIARGLDKRLAGDRIDEVWIGDKTNLLKSPASEIERVLRGAQILAFRRVGKHIVGDLSSVQGPAQWIIHLGMTGRCLVCEPEVEQAKHTHLIATLASGRELRFVDPRRFGKLQVLEGSSFAAPGAEPIAADRSKFAELFKGRKTPIKSALLNQRLLSGIGNIYADESLFRAGVRPRRQAARLTPAELMRLYDGIQEVLAEAIRAGGSSVSGYVDASGNSGFFQLQHRVYQRTGQPCLVCGAAIQRVVIAGRSSHYCPKCQR